MDRIPANQPGQCGRPLPVPTYELGRLSAFSVSCSTTIKASPLKCLEIILNTAEYPSWSKTFRRIAISQPSLKERNDTNAPELQRFSDPQNYLHVGAKIEVDVYMNPDTESPVLAQLEVSVLERFSEAEITGYRVAWKASGKPSFLIHMEQVHVFTETNGSNGAIDTTYTCWETFGGLLSFPMKYFIGKNLESQFSRWAEDLKTQAEKVT